MINGREAYLGDDLTGKNRGGGWKNRQGERESFLGFFKSKKKFPS